MTLLRATIPGAPKAKGRPRFGRGKTYTDAATDAWETAAAWHIRNARPASLPRIVDPVRVIVRAVSERTVRRPDRVAAGAWKQGARTWRVGQADIDNIVKAALDAVTRAGVWTDDNLVVSLAAESLYAAVGEGACVEVEIVALGGAP